MADESDSWSMVDAEDEASRDRTSRTSSSDLSTAEAEGDALYMLCGLYGSSGGLLVAVLRHFAP